MLKEQDASDIRQPFGPAFADSLRALAEPAVGHSAPTRGPAFSLRPGETTDLPFGITDLNSVLSRAPDGFIAALQRRRQICAVSRTFPGGLWDKANEGARTHECC